MGSPLFQEWLHLVGEEVVDAKPAPMGPDDALIIIDMQRDFVPGDPLRNPSGGRFGVAEGDHICPVIVQLIDAAASAGTTIALVFDRDLHCTARPGVSIGLHVSPHWRLSDTFNYASLGLRASPHQRLSGGLATELLGRPLKGYFIFDY